TATSPLSLHDALPISASDAVSISRLASFSSASSSRIRSVAILCTPRCAAPLPYTAVPPDPPSRSAPLPRATTQHYEVVRTFTTRSEEHTSELQSRENL